jgi:hypothetical protein
MELVLIPARRKLPRNDDREAKCTIETLYDDGFSTALASGGQFWPTKPVYGTFIRLRWHGQSRCFLTVEDLPIRTTSFALTASCDLAT